MCPGKKGGTQLEIKILEIELHKFAERMILIKFAEIKFYIVLLF